MVRPSAALVLRTGNVANKTAQIFLHITKRDDKRTYARAAFAKNGRVRPFTVLVGGAEEHHNGMTIASNFRTLFSGVWSGSGRAALIRPQHEFEFMLPQFQWMSVNPTWTRLRLKIWKTLRSGSIGSGCRTERERTVWLVWLPPGPTRQRATA